MPNAPQSLELASVDELPSYPVGLPHMGIGTAAEHNQAVNRITEPLRFLRTHDSGLPCIRPRTPPSQLQILYTKTGKGNNLDFLERVFSLRFIDR